MGVFGDFKNLWHRKRKCSFTPTQHGALPTTKPVTPPTSTQSARKVKTSMVHTLRQRYRWYLTSPFHASDDSTEISTFSLCTPSQLELDFDDDLLENGSLVEFFQNYKMADAVPISKTNSSSRSNIPASSAAYSNTSNQTVATSVSSLPSFKLGLTVAGLPLFRAASLPGGKVFSSHLQTEPASQNCPTCGAGITESVVAVTSGSTDTVVPLPQPKEHQPENEMKSIELRNEPMSEAGALFSKPKEDISCDVYTVHEW
ncbi:hypothetical protein E8E11_009514 [Didymella keratinophila]|nr:hypothetical protein E8E11_009514 [Didymella keratinophila]